MGDGQGGEFACDGSGQVEWARQLGGGADDFSGKLELDGEGGVFVSGAFSGQLDLGGVSAGAGDMFLARYDADGAHLWSKRFGDAAGQGSRTRGTR